MTILVCGGRHYHDREAAFRAIDAVHAKKPITLIISGGAAGADKLAEDWADSRGVPKHVVLADWVQHGNAAGPIRNREMLKLDPDGVVAFPGGRGTADMVKISLAAGKKVWQPYG